jgi:methylmalonyl-CoA mutase C-terminal domain/subunit
MSPPRVFICMVGLDQHENGAVVVSRILRDAGMEVIYGGEGYTAEGIVDACLQEDADVIGISTHTWEFSHYVPELIRLLKAKGLEIPVVVGGSILTGRDATELRDAGVAAVFAAGASPDEIVDTVRTLAARCAAGA